MSWHETEQVLGMIVLVETMLALWGEFRYRAGRRWQRRRILAVLGDHVLVSTAPRGLEQIGPLTMMWGLHTHNPLTPLNVEDERRCVCGAVEIINPVTHRPAWYLPEGQIRAAEETVINRVRRELGEPSLEDLRTRQAEAQQAAMVPPHGGVVV